MKRSIGIIVISLAAIVVYFAFLHAPICVTSAAYRSSFLSIVKICPPFVDIDLDEIRNQFEERVAVGDGPEVIENALAEQNISFSWDRFNQSYNGIIRDSDSPFHAITISVYVDEQGRYKRIEVDDVFTAF